MKIWEIVQCTLWDKNPNILDYILDNLPNIPYYMVYYLRYDVCPTVYDIHWSPYLGAPVWSAPHLWPSELKGNFQKHFQINNFIQSIIDPAPSFILSTCRKFLCSTHSRTQLNSILCPGSQRSRPKSPKGNKIQSLISFAFVILAGLPRFHNSG